MKFEIEITEEEIRGAINQKVRAAITDKSNEWGVSEFIRDRVKAHWEQTVESMILEALNNDADMREKISIAIEKKLRAQITMALKLREPQA